MKACYVQESAQDAEPDYTLSDDKLVVWGTNTSFIRDVDVSIDGTNVTHNCNFVKSSLKVINA